MTDDDLMRFVDGESDAATAAMITVALARDPAVAAKVATAQRLRATAAASFDAILLEPVPERLVALLRPASTVTGIAAARDARARRFDFAQWGALAATLVVGAVVGHFFTSPTVEPLDADAALTRSLDGNPTPAIKIGFSYRDRVNTYCRVFRDDRADPIVGVACHDDEGWRLRVVTTVAPKRSGEYRLAAAELPPAITATIDATIMGTPLDALGEASAAKRGWKR